MKLLAIDGNSIVNRAFYGIKNLSAPDGTPTNAIYGFLSMTGKVVKETAPNAIAVAFDVKQPTFRHKAYDEYKAGRHPTPPEFFVQMDIIKKLLADFKIPMVTCPGFEADDVLGTLAKKCQVGGHECIIYTGDKDSFQLVSKSTSIYLPKTTPEGAKIFIYDEKRIAEEFDGLRPIQMVDLKALQGDKSDNIPGVQGIGPKTAIDLVKKFGNIEKMYEEFERLGNDIPEIVSEFKITKSTAEKLINGRDDAAFSKFLGTIINNVPINVEIEDLIPGTPDQNIIYDDLSKLGLNRFIREWNISREEPERD